MEAFRDLLDLLDQPPSEAAWDAFVDALGQVPDEAAQSLLPEVQARLADWPDHLRVASEEWATRGDLIRLAVCRVAPLTPLLDLTDIFNQELDAFNDGQENEERPPRPEDAELEIGDAYFLSSQKRVLGLCYDHAAGELYAFESAKYDPSKESFRSYDHLYRINYHTGECLRIHSFKWEKSYQRTVCLLLEALSPNRVLLVVSRERYEWAGHASVFIFEGREKVFEHHWEGQRKLSWETLQRFPYSVFRLSDDRKTLWGCHHKKDFVCVELEFLEVTEIPGPNIPWELEIVPVQGGAMRFNVYHEQAFVDGWTYAIRRRLPDDFPAPYSVLACVNFGADNPYFDINDEHPGAFVVLSYLTFDPARQLMQPVSYIGAFYKRKRDGDHYIRFKTRRVGDRWRCAYLYPPDFMDLYVVEFPTGKMGRLRINPNQYSPGPFYEEAIEAFDFDAAGEAIIFDRGSRFWRWDFVLEPGDVVQAYPIKPSQNTSGS
jgi:hypothetical protein